MAASLQNAFLGLLIQVYKYELISTFNFFTLSLSFNLSLVLFLVTSILVEAIQFGMKWIWSESVSLSKKRTNK